MNKKIVSSREKKSVKTIETTQAESEERYRLIFENAPVGIFHYDKNGIIT